MTLKDYVNKYVDNQFSPFDELPFSTTILSIKKGTILTQIGAIENFAYFLNTGIVEMSMITDKNEFIIDFYFDDDFFSSYESLLLEIPSNFQVAALTDIIVERVSRADLNNAYNNSLLANKIGRHATEKLYLKKIKRERNLLAMTTKESYLNLINTNGKLINQIPVFKIAKYLGVEPESLSRIRKGLIS
jgi:CRP-like cAMP-binding protein